jgi:hypothetical protein
MTLFSETNVSQQRDVLQSSPAIPFEQAYKEAVQNKLLPYVKCSISLLLVLT